MRGRACVGQHPAAAAHRHDRARAEHTADTDDERVAPAGAEVVETGLMAQLVTIDDSTRAFQQDGEDRSLPRSQRHRSAAASHRGERNDAS